MSWYVKRFEFSPTKVHKNCQFCNRDLYFPLSKSADRNTCGEKCAAALKEIKSKSRARNCLVCEKEFTPRASQLLKGQGKYCSLKCCHANQQHLVSEQSLKKSQQSRRENLINGKWKPLSGANHYAWKGGLEARLLRNKLSGKRTEVNRKYRKNNPDKVREFSQTRKGRKLGRLPRGTIKEIGNKQQWKCPVCKIDITHKYHVDHIYALANGGKHEKSNIQLLCPSCNVHKSSKDPISYMQQKGFLI